MLFPVILFLIGLVLLIKGGDWFVDGATGIANRFHLPEMLIGATVVSIGTTLPEVMVSATSALSGHSEIAYGNAIGSIICNTALIAAITVAVRPGKVSRDTLIMPVCFFFASAVFYAGIAYTSGNFSRLSGCILLLVFVIYMVATVRKMTNDHNADSIKTEETSPDAPSDEKSDSLAKDIFLLILGAALIAGGADLLVDNGTLIAE
ncbi:MAG: sodium:calcium antiporter, partial [Lachnospiraceae bacterium]|nr:sodium:calcium antiporter [Lachnospiraceae bacterium]